MQKGHYQSAGSCSEPPNDSYRRGNSFWRNTALRSNAQFGLDNWTSITKGSTSRFTLPSSRTKWFEIVVESRDIHFASDIKRMGACTTKSYLGRAYCATLHDWSKGQKPQPLYRLHQWYSGNSYHCERFQWRKGSSVLKSSVILKVSSKTLDIVFWSKKDTNRRFVNPVLVERTVTIGKVVGALRLIAQG